SDVVGCTGTRLINDAAGHLCTCDRCRNYYGSGLRLLNDEPYAAYLWGIPSLSLVALFAIPFAVVVWSVVRTSQGNFRWKVLHVIGLGLTMLIIGTVVSNVDPILFPNR